MTAKRLVASFPLLILCWLLCQCGSARLEQPISQLPAGIPPAAEDSGPILSPETPLLPSPTRTPVPSYTPSATAPATHTPTATPSSSPTVTPTPSPTATPSPEPTITPSAGSLLMPRLDLKPGDPLPYLETFRLFSFYGSPMGWGLGILGESSREEMTLDLQAHALQLQALGADRFVVPAYHMVTTVADDFGGADENYSHQVSMETLEDWIAAANENGIAVILDIQPGLADIQEEFDRIKHLLEFPQVHLALDPEFIIGEAQVPGDQLGKIDAEQINSLQAQLNEIALQIGINRVLIIHQFVDSMIEGKDQILDYPHVELVIDADGVGCKWTKLADYQQYAGEPGADYLGIKIFTRHDLAPQLTLEELMAWSPAPALIIHQ